jgi:predicted nuclease of restriction endonuclease-like (RecB) superfamily
MARAEPVLRTYAQLLEDIKKRVRVAQVRAGLAVNRELVLLYWHVGRRILQAQRREGWGARVIDRLAQDLSRAFPEMRGFSVRNLKYMRAFAEAWPEEAIVQQAVAQLPWGHNVRILDYVSDPAQRLWYAQAAVQHGWSRNVLVHQIESDLSGRRGKALTNFDRALPAPQSELAEQMLKDPYNLDFLGLSEDVAERELERGLLQHLEKFLLELGVGFAFVGRQYRLKVGSQEYYLDLLFYHLRLHRYVAIELKVEEFKPEFVGKMGFYLAAIDDSLRKPPDEPSVGIILCKERNRVVVEYALRYADKPMGVATYRLAPPALRKDLPTPEMLRKVVEAKDGVVCSLTRKITVGDAGAGHDGGSTGQCKKAPRGAGNRNSTGR